MMSCVEEQQVYESYFMLQHTLSTRFEQQFWLMTDCEISDLTEDMQFFVYTGIAPQPSVSEKPVVVASCQKEDTLSTISTDGADHLEESTDSDQSGFESPGRRNGAKAGEDFLRKAQASIVAKVEGHSAPATHELAVAQPGVDLCTLAEVYLAACAEKIVEVPLLRDLTTELIFSFPMLRIQEKAEFTEVLQGMFGEKLTQDLASQFLKSVEHRRRDRGEETLAATKKGNKRGGKKQRRTLRSRSNNSSNSNSSSSSV
mmetsp:Transcript_11701/g.25743  ORF Transcript_11701/g.25743 Transcript_11701/m.25743 type:complete len:258 (+) Transcript_11701:80-853(+)